MGEDLDQVYKHRITEEVVEVEEEAAAEGAAAAEAKIKTMAIVKSPKPTRRLADSAQEFNNVVADKVEVEEVDMGEAEEEAALGASLKQ